ncbi:serine protease inhibitor 42Dd-like isoform X4 [Malaya genurostris]|uniref:serine protease inhibitor 42Dd-like isoform X2 n=1 Tax=Malaya genurostris TaxID=325434 RepID=UPI0026F37E9D|nr:serine protease inhibitor 42Dd-like isoform X2 [Malaya genurostris]XP_058466339.1 serine protease inhibitor 42Dd-like isoform X3 [Malaya genurostris]XP_058466340.1 serine protease inhibitor 42Dd-like isoform X4 [Malaya genurostris]
MPGCNLLLLLTAFILTILKSANSNKMANTVDELFVRKTNDFALELYKQIISSTEKNVVISPFSISTCLSFAAMGATGLTAEEMFSVLKYGNASEKSKIAKNYGNVLEKLESNDSLKIANKMYIMDNYSLKRNFHDIAAKNFRSNAEHINFADNTQAAKTINSWVEIKTKEKIKDLISPDILDDNTRMVLVNAIHFKGTWVHQFDPAATTPMPFWISATESVDVPMMQTKKHFKHGVFEDLGFAALELSYNDSDVSMLILLPNERDGLSILEHNLLGLDIFEIQKKMYNQEVNVFLPKFKIEFDIDLKNTLEKLGMCTMFTDQADFSDLLDQSEPLKVSNVVHKAFIEVNEEGAEAAAATATAMRVKRSCRLTTSFNVNRPFVYILQSKTQIVFIGKMIRSIRTVSNRHEEL